MAGKFVEPHIPVLDKSTRDDATFSPAGSYNQEAEVYICPAGKVLPSTGTRAERWSNATLSRQQT
jgi:hypothetical protein